jgi:hypothetical protein
MESALELFGCPDVAMLYSLLASALKAQ